MYKGNDWRPVVDKGIPAFTQKPSLGVGAGVYPPSFGVIQATRAARCARLLPTVFGSSAENAFACSLSTSIRADHRAVLGMHDGHDHFRKRAAKDGQIGGRPGSSGGSRAMSCARVGHDGYHFASHIVHAGPSMVSPGLALPGQVSWLVRSAPLFRRRLTESVSTLPERGSLSLLRI